MVLGAGRGPLVSASIRASRQAARKIKVYAVEKNPNAIVTYVAYHCCFGMLFPKTWKVCFDHCSSLNYCVPT